jgi:imidazole glycerol-phosphate synthase subunit HisH
VTSAVTIVDHGAGNLRSLRAALDRAGAEATVTDQAADVRNARLIVLPGVGAAAPAMRALEQRGLRAALEDALAGGARMLGVCVGMQLLFERSAEGGTPCLGLLPGRVDEIDWAPRVPHMGWNDVNPAGDGPLAEALPALCYFAHSYAVIDAGQDAVAGTTEIAGRQVVSAVSQGRITGVQFHPEKSGPAGRAILEAWVRDAAA